MCIAMHAFQLNNIYIYIYIYIYIERERERERENNLDEEVAKKVNFVQPVRS